MIFPCPLILCPDLNWKGNAIRMKYQHVFLKEKWFRMKYGWLTSKKTGMLVHKSQHQILPLSITPMVHGFQPLLFRLSYLTWLLIVWDHKTYVLLAWTTNTVKLMFMGKKGFRLIVVFQSSNRSLLLFNHQKLVTLKRFHSSMSQRSAMQVAWPLTTIF